MTGDVSLKITGDATALITALAQAKAAVSQATAQMKASLESVGGAFEKLQGAFVAITAILAGGEAFKEAISASVNTAIAARDLGEKLGVTATQASVLKVAMDANLVSQDAVTAAAGRLTQTLVKHPEAFRAIGVATTDSNGALRSTFDIMLDVNSKLLQFKEGTDRNVEALKIYGRGWQEVIPALRLTTESMEEARVRAQALHLEVGERGLAQAVAYKTAMAGLHETFEALEKVIGDALTPVLTAIGQWFGEIGPAAVKELVSAVVLLYGNFEALKVVVETVWNVIAGMVEFAVVALAAVGDVLVKAVSGDFSGARDSAKAAWDAIAANAKNRINAIKEDYTEANANIQALNDRLAKPDTAVKPTGGDKKGDPEPAEKTQLPKLLEALSVRRQAYEAEADAEGSLREFGKAQEAEYWQSVLASTTLSAADRRAVTEKLNADLHSIRQQEISSELSELKGKEGAYKHNLDARLALEQEYLVKVKQAYGEDSAQYAAAQNQILATKREIAAQDEQIERTKMQAARDAQLGEIADAKAAEKIKYELGEVGLKEYLAAERNFENQSYAIKLQALQDKLALDALDPDADKSKLAADNAAIEALALQHHVALNKITAEGVTEEKNQWKTFANSLQSGLDTAFKGIVNGTLTVTQAFRKLYLGLLDTVVSTLSQIAAKWIVNHLLAKVLNRDQADSNAAVAATGAAASAAAIPYIGWILAISAAASVFQAAKGYSAAQGFDVPLGLNPLTQLHSKEMVLPANLADTVRGLAAGGSGGGGTTHHHTWHIATHDSRDFVRALKNNDSDLARIVRDSFHRNNIPLKK